MAIKHNRYGTGLRRYHPAMVFVLLFWGFLVYSNTFLVPLQFDDLPSITHNPAIKHISDLRAIWSFWPTRFLTYFSLALNYHFHRLDVWGYHVFNLAVHLGSALLVWWLGLLTFSTPAMKDQKISQNAGLLTYFAALVFVAHPLQTQAVTYVVQRATSLAAFFYLASLCFYARSRLPESDKEGSGVRKLYRIGALAAAVMAMFAKEMAITLPLMVCLYEFSFFRREGRAGLRRLVPFLALLLVIPLTMGLTGSVDFREMRRAVEPLPGLSCARYLLTQFRVLVTYIRLLFFPFGQNMDYDYPIAQSLSEPPVWAGLLFLAGIILGGVRLFGRYRLLSFGIFWFFLALFPESSFIPIRDVIFEHRLYLPMVGYGLFLASSLYYLLMRYGRKAAIAVFFTIIVFYSALAYARNALWGDEAAFLEDIVRKSPQKARAYLGRGYVHQEKGDPDQALADYDKVIAIDPDFIQSYVNRGNLYQEKGDLDKALQDYNRALAIHPGFAEGLNSRGFVYEKKGDRDLALADYTKAIEAKPDYAEAYNNRGNLYQKEGASDLAISDYDRAIGHKPDFVEAYVNRGNFYQERGDLDKAIEDFSLALVLKPDFAEALVSRAFVYRKKGDLDLALADYEQAIRIKPDYAEAFNGRGLVNKRKGRPDEALSDVGKAIEIRPDYAEALSNRGNLFLAKGDLGRAVSDYSKAIELNPEAPEAYNNRGCAYQGQGDLDKALADFNKVIELNPGDADVYNNRGNIYQVKGSLEEALSDYNKALEIRPDDAEVYNNRGGVYQRKGDVDRALRDYNKAIALDPDYAQAYKNRAVVLFDRGEYAKSREDLRRAEALGLKADPKFVAELDQALGAAGATR